jgi:hypothetical protein
MKICGFFRTRSFQIVRRSLSNPLVVMFACVGMIVG